MSLVIPMTLAILHAISRHVPVEVFEYVSGELITPPERYGTALKTTAGAAPRLDAGPQGPSRRRDDR